MGGSLTMIASLNTLIVPAAWDRLGNVPGWFNSGKCLAVCLAA
jgi:hypothetical protein